MFTLMHSIFPGEWRWTHISIIYLVTVSVIFDVGKNSGKVYLNFCMKNIQILSIESYARDVDLTQSGTRLVLIYISVVMELLNTSFLG